MVKVLMHGCSGHMGQVISELCRHDPDVEITAGVDICIDGKYTYPVYASLGECGSKADVIIDFSHASCVDDILRYSIEKGIPVVLCTTGLLEEQKEAVREASRKVAILKSANMSLGINTLIELLREAAGALVPAGFDVEIVEKHHNQKLDAPSGTALALADAVNGTLGDAYSYTYDRSGERKIRDPHEIGISAVRGGNIVGEHEVFFAGTDEVITFKHTAYSKAVFGKGAIEAAKYLAGKPAGLYGMADVIRG